MTMDYAFITQRIPDSISTGDIIDVDFGFEDGTGGVFSVHSVHADGTVVLLGIGLNDGNILSINVQDFDGDEDE